MSKIRYDDRKPGEVAAEAERICRKVSQQLRALYGSWRDILRHMAGESAAGSDDDE